MDQARLRAVHGLLKIEFAETMAEIERCYGKIAPRKQLIMLLQHLNYDYAAIGKVLGINSDSVRKNIARITPLTNKRNARRPTRTETLSIMPKEILYANGLRCSL